jgi:hypothetical protein
MFLWNFIAVPNPNAVSIQQRGAKIFKLTNKTDQVLIKYKAHLTLFLFNFKPTIE